eukprot:g1873.t1
MTRWTEEEVGHLKRIATSKHFQCKESVSWKKAHKELEKHIPHRSIKQCERKWSAMNCERISTARVRKHRKRKREEFHAAATNGFRTRTRLVKYINPENTARRERRQKKHEKLHAAAMNGFGTPEEAALLTPKVKDTIVEGKKKGYTGDELLKYIDPITTYDRERQQKKAEQLLFIETKQLQKLFAEGKIKHRPIKKEQAVEIALQILKKKEAVLQNQSFLEAFSNRVIALYVAESGQAGSKGIYEAFAWLGRKSGWQQKKDGTFSFVKRNPALYKKNGESIKPYTEGRDVYEFEALEVYSSKFMRDALMVETEIIKQLQSIHSGILFNRRPVAGKRYTLRSVSKKEEERLNAEIELLTHITKNELLETDFQHQSMLSVFCLFLIGYAEAVAPIASFSTSFPGYYEILLDNLPFLKSSGQIRVRDNGRDYCTNGLNCTQLTPNKTSAHISHGFDDKWGNYSIETFYWGSGPSLNMSLQSFQQGIAVINFEVTSGLKNSSASILPPAKGHLSNSFLSFETNTTESLNFLTWNSQDEFSYQTGAGGFEGACKLNQCDEYSGLPIVLYNGDNRLKHCHSVAISPVNNFKDLEVNLRDNTWNVGLRRALVEVPSGYSVGFVIVPGQDCSPRKTMDRWGQLMREKYDRKLHNPLNSIDSSHLGYWFDNGATYYYTPPYEPLMRQLKSYHYETGLNRLFKYFQFDSWFYRKGNQGGILEWDADPAMVPHGLSNLVHNILQVDSIVGHSRWFSPNATYVNNDNWKIDHKDGKPSEVEAIPFKNVRSFYRSLVSKAKHLWGLRVYEQDWLDAIFTKSTYFTEYPGRIENFMIEMGKAMSDENVTVGYGSANPYHLMTALQFDSATFVFASNNPDSDADVEQNYHISRSAILTHQVGMVAMKDVFWSSSQFGNVHNNKRYNFTHGWPSSAMHAAIATLSNGPVAVGDAIGASNKTLLLRTCNAEGALLRPTRPCLATDASLAPDFTGEFCDAIVDIEEYRYHYIFSAALEMGQLVELETLDRKNTSVNRFYVTDASPLNPVPEGLFDLGRILPYGNHYSVVGASHQWNLLRLAPSLMTKGNVEFFFLGELDKFVSVSQNRFNKIRVIGENLVATVAGTENEDVHIDVAVVMQDNVTRLRTICHFQQEGSAMLICLCVVKECRCECNGAIEK